MENNTKKTLLTLGLLLAIPVFAWQQIAFWGFGVKAADTAAQTPADLAAQQAAQDAIKKKQNKIQDQIDQAEKDKAKLQQNLGQIQTAVSVTQVKINQSKNVIKQASQSISQKEKEIQDLNDRIDFQKQLLKAFLQQIYYTQNQPILNVVLVEGDFADFFADADKYMSLDDRIRETIIDIKNTQLQIEQDKALLNQTKDQSTQLLSAASNQQQNLLADQTDTQQSIDDKNATIAKLQQQLNELQGNLSAMLGKSYSIDQIWSAVKTASKLTGVPKGFLMGILGTETHFGSNIGTGTYKTDMNPNQRSTFESLCKSLGYDPNKMPVSKRVCYNKKAKDGCGGWGGAMGAEQFIPTTWMGYTDRVSSKTGHSPADPWNLVDGITAMAIKLSNTPGVTSGSSSALKTATCSYLGTCSASYMNSVMYWVNNYQDVLND